MRRLILAVCLMLAALGTSVSASAQVGHPTPQERVATILARFPAGGPELRAAIARAVEADPSLAAVVVAAAATANPDQQSAIGAGLADASSYFAKLGTAWAIAAEQQIESAIQSAPAATLVAYELAGGTGVASTIPGVNSSTITTNSCVSPSRPGHGC